MKFPMLFPYSSWNKYYHNVDMEKNLSLFLYLNQQLRPIKQSHFRKMGKQKHHSILYN